MNIQELDKETLTTTNEFNQYYENNEIPFCFTNDYLYHGIRFQTYLEKLESIFKDRKIFAGKYINGYYPYSDNCNKGNYVSLLQWNGDNIIEYETFIESNISLLVTPLCNAIETKYVSYDTWEEIQKHDINFKHIYSYLHGECMCKDYIPIDMVKAIGVPYDKLTLKKNKNYADKLIKDIEILMKKYDINLPVVDTSRYNHILLGNRELYYGNRNKVREKLR